MSEQPQATILFLRVSGDEAVKSASEVLSRMLAGMIPPEATKPITAATVDALPAPEEIADEPDEQITAPRKVRYRKAKDEPDGFNAPAPAASTPSFVVERKQKVKGTTVTAESARPPGALASKILKILDSGTGVAPLEHLIRETGTTAHGLNMAITKCPQLQRLGDGRIAVSGYRDED